MKRENFITLIIWLGIITVAVGGFLLLFGILSMLFSFLLVNMMYSSKVVALWGLMVLVGGMLISLITYYYGEQYYYRG